MQECLLQRLLELGIITTAEVDKISPGARVRPDVRGEPLVVRRMVFQHHTSSLTLIQEKLLAVPAGHLEILATFIGAAPGAQHAFCTEVLNVRCMRDSIRDRQT